MSDVGEVAARLLEIFERHPEIAEELMNRQESGRSLDPDRDPNREPPE